MMMCGISLRVQAVPILLGPIPYSEFADSPFYGLTLSTFYLEDFEDGSFNTPGVAGVANAPGVSLKVYGPSMSATDSVDGDDGVVDGSGSGGYSLAGFPNIASENEGFTFTFDALALGGLPTHVGIVWTDGGLSAPTLFEAFGETGQSLGQIGPVHISDNSWYGTTSEDHFFGAIYDNGISKIVIRDPGGHNNLEVDHLQYGLNVSPVPEPSTMLLLGSGFIGLAGLRRRLIAKIS